MRKGMGGRMVKLLLTLALMGTLSAGAAEARASGTLCWYTWWSLCDFFCDSGTQPGCSCIECVE